MLEGASVKVIIPALNEAPSIGRVIGAIPAWVDEIVVVDNGSTDATGDVAIRAGARVVCEPRRGYGQACLTGLSRLGPCDVVVFLDGDFSDHPDEMHRLVEPIVRGRADLVVGSRVRGRAEPGALTLTQRFGNRLACGLIGFFWHVRYTDLGPFRAIRASALAGLDMRDRNYGWTVEMQIKAAHQRLRTCEVAVSYRRRIGRSKISGTIRGIVGAGTKIMATILRAALQARRCEAAQPGERLIVFTRYPEPGLTKTRLIPTLGARAAADLQRRMAEHTLIEARRHQQRCRCALEARYEGGDSQRMADWLGGDLTCRPQGDGDLGQRLGRAFRAAFDQGARSTVIIGTDCPDLTGDVLDRAFSALRDRDVVLGPARDGGYYLIGLRCVAPELFCGVSWGTDRVRAETLATAERLGLSVALLDPLDDVDRPEDLPVWERIAGETGVFRADQDGASTPSDGAARR